MKGSTAMEGLSATVLGAATVTAGVPVTAIGPHWLVDILQVLRTEILETHLDLALDVIIGCARNQYAARFCDGLQACRDVDAIPIEIAALDHYIAEINPNAQHDVRDRLADRRSP